MAFVSSDLYRARNLAERIFNKIKRSRRIASCHENFAADYSFSSSALPSASGSAPMSPRPDAAIANTSRSELAKHTGDSAPGSLETWSRSRARKAA
jgi:hypothetical protein